MDFATDPIVPQDQAPEPSTVPTAADYRRNFFVGTFGLRAIWSLLIYICLIVVLAVAVRKVHDAITHKGAHKAVAASSSAAPQKPATTPENAEPDKMAPMITQEVILFALVFFAAWIMSRIERRNFGAYGLGGERSLSRFLFGSLWGLIAMGLFIATLCACHLLVFDARLDHGFAILGWGAVQLFAFFLVGLFEEFLFRGYIQFTLTRGMVSIGNLFSPRYARIIGFWVASTITSAIFYKAHTGNSGETAFGLITVFLAGLLFVVALWRTGSLWWAIGFHMAWDWSQSFLYGVPDSGGLMQGRLFATHAMGKPLLSGGTDGPEGSLIAIPIIILMIVVLLYTHPSQQPPLEPNPGAAVNPPESRPLIA